MRKLVRRRHFVRGAVRSNGRVIAPTHKRFDCDRCGRSVYGPIAETRCPSCLLKAGGAQAVGMMPSGEQPVLSVGCDGALLQECTGPCCQGWNKYSGLAKLHAQRDLDAMGRCAFCLLPGEWDEKNRVKAERLDNGAIRYRWADYVDPLVYIGQDTFTLNHRGERVPGSIVVFETSQSGGPSVPKLVTPSCRPAWGTGWELQDAFGVLRSYMSNWDSSD